MEQLEEFGLPESFPPSMFPEKAALFVAETKKGMSKDELIAIATERGFQPMWKSLPHIGIGVYGLGLDVDGLQVPLMVKMRLNAELS